MTSPSASRRVTFRHAFALPGMAESHPPGTFDLLVEDVPLELADARLSASVTAMTLLLPAGRSIESWPVRSEDLEALLASDRLQDSDTGRS